MPIKELEKIEKLEEVYRKRVKELGLIGYNGDNFQIIKNSRISKFVDFNYKMMMDRIIRGFHKNGINCRVSYR